MNKVIELFKNQKENSQKLHFALEHILTFYKNDFEKIKNDWYRGE